MNEILEQSLLFDFYGELLTTHQKNIYEQYVLEDLSLGEIAQIEGISRQGVHDLVKRCNLKLLNFEKKLHLVEKFLTIKHKIEAIEVLIDESEECNLTETINRVKRISKDILEEL